ncbi:MAG: dihydrolipoamide acetyltransferase family protein [bacterium]|nr:dihydrolipoamide acetyltransferase family protein [bacterium]
MHILRLPALGETMEMGTIIAWFKAEGEEVAVGEALYEVENEKSAIVVEAMGAGLLAKIVAPVSTEVRVGAAVAVMAEVGSVPTPEQIAELLSGEASADAPAAPGPAPATRPERKDPGPKKRIRAMPKARALAKSLGVDLAGVQGTGRAGIITPDDVEAAAAEAGPSGPGVRERRPLRGYPRAMAAAMARNWTEIPHFSQTVSVWAGPLLLRLAACRSEGLEVSLNDLMVSAVVGACREVPEVNAALSGKSVIVYDEVNVAVGVDTPHGLAAPVVHGADRMGLGELAAEIRRLADAARRRKLTFSDIGGATITTSNLGPKGVDFGTPIISLNTAATIYFGTIAERPMVVDGRVVAGPTFYVSGAFDHRVVDGATGARFLRALGAVLESE